METLYIADQNAKKQDENRTVLFALLSAKQYNRAECMQSLYFALHAQGNESAHLSRGVLESLLWVELIYIYIYA